MSKKSGLNEKIILGVDPGTIVLGYGLILIKENKVSLMQYGVIRLAKYTGSALKLSKIFQRVIQLIDEYKPDEMAIESPFYGKNVQSMLKLGRAQGVAIAAALSRQIPVVEYEPKKVKQSVTGNGNASKEQVSAMIGQLLNIKNKDADQLPDATDALAVALCHYYKKNALSGKSKDWSTFVRENPDRIR
ncbi:MAG: crossover junction endodeoxyribonuclease RuvC [Cytophagaceae bacterium]|nr:crossover junction endodeoxyribonuclease RuvC [Cytophagaceae bacterium]MDW8456379.1 crossover junction endodeoxyribonuclease RuvC [Cytophagaceae bacterium]